MSSKANVTYFSNKDIYRITINNAPFADGIITMKVVIEVLTLYMVCDVLNIYGLNIEDRDNVRFIMLK